MAKSWMDRLVPEIREKFDWLRFHRFEDGTLTEQYCEELIDHGKMQNDPALIGACYYYIGELNYTRMLVSEAISQLEIALMYLDHSDAPRVQANACVTLGCIHLQSFSYEAAMDFFLRGLAICEKHDFGFTAGTLYANMATIHIALRNYPEALDCLKNSWSNYGREHEAPDYHLHCLISNRLQMAVVLLYMNNIPGAELCIREIENLMSQQTKRTWDLCSYYHLKILYCEQTHDEGKLVDYLQKFQDSYHESIIKTDIMATAVSLVEDLNKRNRKDLLKILKPMIDALLLADPPASLRMTLLKVCWDILEDKKSDDAFSLMEEVFKTQDKLAAYEYRTKNAAVHTLLSRNARFKQAEEWMMIANNDTLTGLWNRRYYESRYQEMHALATARKIPIAVGIMDIDFFKQYNDHYGHLEGDNCLKTVAALLKEQASEHLEFARYGGDEFLLLSTGLSEDVLRDEMNRFYEALAETNILHQYSEVSKQVTISMGISFHSDPSTAGISVADLISEADKLLYQVKKNGKNDFLIGVQ